MCVCVCEGSSRLDKTHTHTHQTHSIELVVEATRVAHRVSILHPAPENSLGRATVGTLVVHALERGFLLEGVRGGEGRVESGSVRGGDWGMSTAKHTHTHCGPSASTRGSAKCKNTPKDNLLVGKPKRAVQAMHSSSVSVSGNYSTLQTESMLPHATGHSGLVVRPSSYYSPFTLCSLLTYRSSSFCQQ